MTLPMAEKRKPSWSTIFFRSGIVAAVAATAASIWIAEALLLLAALFGLGFIAGLWSRRHGWLAGCVVGFPAAWLQTARWAGGEAFTPDWWALAVPAGFVAAAMAVLGGMTGAWLRDMRLQRA
jgi:hypothetical protein